MSTKTTEVLCPRDGIEFTKLWMTVNQAVLFFVEACHDLNPKGKTGAVLLYENREGQQEHGVVGHGSIDESLYLAVARNKIAQLHKHPEFKTSAPKRNPDLGLYDGGLNFQVCGKAAISGLPEPADGACLLAAVCKLKIVSEVFVIQAIGESRNREYFDRIWEGVR